MLSVHPDDRIATEDILTHHWVTRHCNSTAAGGDSAIANDAASINSPATSPVNNPVIAGSVSGGVGGEGDNSVVGNAVMEKSALENAVENSFSSNEDESNVR